MDAINIYIQEKDNVNKQHELHIHLYTWANGIRARIHFTGIKSKTLFRTKLNWKNLFKRTEPDINAIPTTTTTQ